MPPASGACEKLIMPSIAYFNSFQKFHFVSPATRFTFSYGSQYVRKPIHPKIPLLENGCILPSPRSRPPSPRFISLKSRAPSTISASEIRVDNAVKLSGKPAPDRRFSLAVDPACRHTVELSGCKHRKHLRKKCRRILHIRIHHCNIVPLAFVNPAYIAASLPKFLEKER